MRDHKLIATMYHTINKGWDDYSFGHINFRITAIDDNGETLLFDQPEYCGIIISCQYNADEVDADNPRFYAWDISYECHGSINLESAERKYKSLKKIDKKLEKYRKEWGVANTYADYVKRALKAMGVTRIIKAETGSSLSIQDIDFSIAMSVREKHK